MAAAQLKSIADRLRSDAALVKVEAEALPIPPLPADMPTHPVDWTPEQHQAARIHYSWKSRRTELRSASKRLGALADELEFGPKRLRRRRRRP